MTEGYKMVWAAAYVKAWSEFSSMVDEEERARHAAAEATLTAMKLRKLGELMANDPPERQNWQVRVDVAQMMGGKE